MSLQRSLRLKSSIIAAQSLLTCNRSTEGSNGRVTREMSFKGSYVTECKCYI